MVAHTKKEVVFQRWKDHGLTDMPPVRKFHHDAAVQALSQLSEEETVSRLMLVIGLQVEQKSRPFPLKNDTRKRAEFGELDHDRVLTNKERPKYNSV